VTSSSCGLPKQRREALQSELDSKAAEVRERFEADRDQLMWLAPKQLLNETRYRELRERWGRAFSAGMGAEAIYDIVAKIDLDKMAEELRDEIRSTRSKQRRKKGHLSGCRSWRRWTSPRTDPSG